MVNEYWQPDIALDLRLPYYTGKWLLPWRGHDMETFSALLSGEPDYFGRNEISSGGDLSHYSSASLY